MANTRWVRIDSTYFQNPKIVPLSSEARLIHLGAICYSAQHVTNGLIVPGALRALAGCVPKEARYLGPAISQLVAGNLLVPTEDGWMIHDFVAMNGHSTREAVDRDRVRAAERKRRSRVTVSQRDEGQS